MKQARFWIVTPQGGIVRIKINAGQGLAHCTAWQHDEGWSSEANAWAFDGRIVRMTYSSTDCDGRMQHFGEGFCRVNDLAAGSVDQDEGVVFPAWDWTSRCQRDY